MLLAEYSFCRTVYIADLCGFFNIARAWRQKRHCSNCAVYSARAVGLPVFHSFTGGPGILLGPGGGYITGFLLLSLTYWLITKKAGENIRTKVFALLTGILLCYLTGCIQFALVSKVSVKSAVLTCVVPFILPDAVKLILSLLLSNKLAKINKV